MYRTNAQRRAIEEAFLRYGIRYQLVGGTRFYQRREVKDALAYLRVLRRDTRRRRFERIINVPARGDRRQDASRRCGADAARDGGDVWAAHRGGRPTARSRGSRRGPGRRSAEFVGARRAAADADRRAAAARAARRGARGVRLPGDARRRLRGGRGPLGQPARAARGRRPATTTSRPRTRSTGCSRRRPWSPTRTPTRARPTR